MRVYYDGRAWVTLLLARQDGRDIIYEQRSVIPLLAWDGAEMVCAVPAGRGLETLRIIETRGWRRLASNQRVGEHDAQHVCRTATRGLRGQPSLTDQVVPEKVTRACLDPACPATVLANENNRMIRG